MRPLSSQWIPAKLTSSPICYYSTPPPLHPTPTYLGVTFDRSLSFSIHVSSLKAKFFPRLKAFRCISASSWSPLKSPSLICIKLLLGPISLMLHPNGFYILALLTFLCWNAFTEQLVAPSSAGSRFSPSLFSSLRRLYLPYEPPWFISPCLFYERALRPPISFSISGLARLGVKPRLSRS